MKRFFIISIFLLLSLFAKAQIYNVHFQHSGNIDRDEYRKTIYIPDIPNYKTLKCDFHIHTIFSDGVVLPQERVNEAWREGIDVIAITDHDFELKPYLKGDHNTSYEMAKPVAEAKGITLIKALEYTRGKPVGHFNFLFIDDANPYVTKYRDNPEKAIETAVDKGAFIIYNHPGWPDKNSDLLDFQIKLLKEKKIHALEVFNHLEFYPKSIDDCNTYDVAPISATDIHSPIAVQFDLAKYPRNMTLVFAKENTQESVKDALMAGRTVAYSCNTLAGKPEYIKALVKASLEVSDSGQNANNYWFTLKNISDFDFYFENNNYNRIIIPAHSSVKVSGKINEKEVIYKLNNAFVAGGKNLEVPISFLGEK